MQGCRAVPESHLIQGQAGIQNVLGRQESATPLCTTLIDREKRERPQQSRALDRRIAAWKQEVKQVWWTKPAEIKAVYGTADVVGNNRSVFDICGNRYRLIVQFNYVAQIARIRFAGTHAEYDEIDATTV
ncbi:type II toxin-antitoxin system HigB family toxin [Magnetospirillum fulvum]|uniref:type II toxin-antitoxin system HigB family toxin n=1 Tax=Magnetospirillum fulvum TaxID=1082 RepID=UPI0009F1994F|nr:type II toxin-antitoxin system HigB family toxin [Magnetospirillum fulvum]